MHYILFILCFKMSLIASLDRSTMFNVTLTLPPYNYNINSIDMDNQGNFVVSYQTNQTTGLIAKYSPSLESIVFTIVKGQTYKYQQASNIPNSRTDFYGDVLLNQQNNSIYVYNSTTKVLQKQYDYASTIKAFNGFTFQLGNLKLIQVLALTTNSFVYGMQYDATFINVNHNAVGTMPVLSIATAMKSYQSSWTSGSNIYFQTYFQYSNNDNLEVDRLEVVIQIYVSGSAIIKTIYINFYTNIISTLNTVYSFIKYNNLIYSQDSAGNHEFYHIFNGITTFNNGQNFTQNQTLAIFQKDYKMYALQIGGLYELSFDQAIDQGTNQVLIVRKIDNLPTLDYRVVVGSNFTLTYVPQTTQVYAQTYPSNLMLYSQIDQNVFFRPFKSQVLQKTLEMTTQTLQQVITVPGARRVISPLFYFFSCFDDIYLYQFHDRKYGKTMTALFQFTDSIEEQKWALVNYTKVLSTLGVSVQQYDNITSHQRQYQTYKFTTTNHKQLGSQGLMFNCNNFFLVTLPILVVVFIVFRILFKILFNYPISVIFRKFDFVAFLFLLLFDGNIQQFSFYMASEWLHLFHFNLAQKISKMIIILFGFLLIMLSVAFYFICYSTYKKLNRILMDNNRNRLSGVFFLTLQVFFRNFYLGFLNSFLRITNYYTMMTVLIISQVFFLVILAISINGKIYKKKSSMWIYVIINAIKILLLTTFVFDYEAAQTPQILEEIQLFLISLQLGVFMLGIVYETISSVFEIISMIKNIFCRQTPQDSKQKQINDQKIRKTQVADNSLKNKQNMLKLIKNKKAGTGQKKAKKNMQKHPQNKKARKKNVQNQKKVKFENHQSHQKTKLKYDRSNLDEHFNKIRQYDDKHQKMQIQKQIPKNHNFRDLKKTHDKPDDKYLSVNYLKTLQKNKIQEMEYPQIIFLNKQKLIKNKKGNADLFEKMPKDYFQVQSKFSVSKQKKDRNLAKNVTENKQTKKQNIKPFVRLNPLIVQQNSYQQPTIPRTNKHNKRSTYKSKTPKKSRFEQK